GLFLLGLFAAIALVAIRGYELTAGELRVARPLWSTTHSLAGLSRVARDPNALGTWTLRGFGNNGFFAVNGWRKIPPSGWCRVLATDPPNAVVLCTPGGNYVVTPDRLDEFVAQAETLVQRL